jgi:hypothetical protein
MNLDQAREIVLQLVRAKGRITNSEIEEAVGGDAALARRVRETLIMEDLAEDCKNVGVAYIGPPPQPEPPDTPLAAPMAASQETDKDAPATESQAPAPPPHLPQLRPR